MSFSADAKDLKDGKSNLYGFSDLKSALTEVASRVTSVGPSIPLQVARPDTGAARTAVRVKTEPGVHVPNKVREQVPGTLVAVSAAATAEPEVVRPTVNVRLWEKFYNADTLTVRKIPVGGKSGNTLNEHRQIVNSKGHVLLDDSPQCSVMISTMEDRMNPLGKFSSADGTMHVDHPFFDEDFIDFEFEHITTLLVTRPVRTSKAVTLCDGSETARKKTVQLGDKTGLYQDYMVSAQMPVDIVCCKRKGKTGRSRVFSLKVSFTQMCEAHGVTVKEMRKIVQPGLGVRDVKLGFSADGTELKMEAGNLIAIMEILAHWDLQATYGLRHSEKIVEGKSKTNGELARFYYTEDDITAGQFAIALMNIFACILHREETEAAPETTARINLLVSDNARIASENAALRVALAAKAAGEAKNANLVAAHVEGLNKFRSYISNPRVSHDNIVRAAFNLVGLSSQAAPPPLDGKSNGAAAASVVTPRTSAASTATAAVGAAAASVRPTVGAGYHTNLPAGPTSSGMNDS